MKKPQRSATVGRPPAKASRDTRELLLKSATELFAEFGVAATTFVMIAKRAGVTPAMMHYYFEDRDELCDAVVNERLLQIIAQVWNPLDRKAVAAATIQGVIERMMGCIQHNAWIPALWIREVLSEGGLLRERVIQRIPLQKLHAMAEAVARGQADGSINPEIEPLLVATSTVGLVMLSMAATKVLPRIMGKSIGPEAIQGHVTSLLLDGIRYRKPKPLRPVSRRER
jgi:AcrR family transcriptional regulator